MHLIELTEFKEYKGIKSPDQDTKITIIIDSLSAFIKNYCGRTFTDYYSVPKTEYFNSNLDYIYVTEVPIKDVVSVKTSTNGGVDQLTLVENTDYFVDTQSDSIIANGSCFNYSVINHKSLEIAYTGGYLTIPDDLKMALMDFIDYYKNQEYIPRKTAGSSSKDNVIISPSSIPPYIKNIFDLYRV